MNKPLLKSEQQTHAAVTARKVLLSGQVQGVGFRPFIYRLATEHHLTGWVRNCVGVVEVHVQGLTPDLDDFLSDIFTRKPPLAVPELESIHPCDPGDYTAFNILHSVNNGEARIS
ncbi:MAG TPA: acylphosphatase, partial [Gammaproteobacteria bacterium]|nr:acylphosphatase [Gammaproteobacteria bacterium]